jgi:DNA-binding MarR family transcriptional regulator
MSNPKDDRRERGEAGPDPRPVQLRARRSAGQAIARLARQLERGLEPLDLSLPQYRILALLAEGSSVSSSLASRLAVSPPSVTSVVDGLVGRGLVLRKHDPDDRRRLNLELTVVGHRLLMDADRSVHDRLLAIAAHLDGTPSDIAMANLESWHIGLDAHRAARLEAKTQPSDR